MAKSFTIKLGADTTDFINEMKKADKQISSTQRTAQELEKSLDLKFDSSRAVEAQKLYQKALTETEQKAEAIRNQLKILESSGRMETTDYQKLQTELAKSEAQALKLKNQLDNVKNIEIEKISKKFTDVGNDITKAGQKLSVFSAAAAGAIAGIVKLTKDAVEQGDEISKLATQYDMSTKAIQQWEYVALQSDVSTDSILKGAQKVQAAFGDQMTGATSTATKALEALGLNYKNFDSNEQAFEATITELSKIKNATEQAAYANDIFGERFASSLR
jgi:predicted  nucleic acid-binding Zn-ribbon protein